MSDGMTQNQATLIGEGVSLHTPNTLPDAVKSPTWNADGTFNGWAAPVSPAGVGTELQYRDEDEFGGVPGSSFVSGILTVPRLNVQAAAATVADFTATGGSTSALFQFATAATSATFGIYTNSTIQLDCSQHNLPFQIFTDAGTEHVYLDNYANANAFGMVFRKQRQTGGGVVVSGDVLGSLNFQGYSGAAGYVTGAQIRAVSEGTIATTRVPSKLVFVVGTDAAPTVLTDVLSVNSDLSVRFLASNPAIYLKFHNEAGYPFFDQIQGAAGNLWFGMNGTVQILFNLGGGAQTAIGIGGAVHSAKFINSDGGMFASYDTDLNATGFFAHGSGNSLAGIKAGSIISLVACQGKIGIGTGITPATSQLQVVQSANTTPGISVEGVVNQSVPLLRLKAGQSPTGNIVEINSNSGSNGNLVKVSANGDVVTFAALTGACTFTIRSPNNFIELILDGSGNEGYLTCSGGIVLNGNVRVAGAMRFGTHTALAAEAVTGYITIKDAANQDRKLAVVS